MARRRHPPPGLVTGLVAILAASALSNFVIAWGCMIAAPPVLGPCPAAPELGAIIDRTHPLPPGFVVQGRRIPACPWNGITEAYAFDNLLGHDGAGGTIFAMRGYQIWTAGWPCRSLAAAELSSGLPLPGPSDLRGGLRIPGLTNSVPGSPPRPLPYLPLWRGFLINTALYAAALAAVALLVRHLRHRHPAGSCHACGYDLRGLPTAAPCPECGAALPLRPSPPPGAVALTPTS